jgi:hypothetical protein
MTRLRFLAPVLSSLLLLLDCPAAVAQPASATAMGRATIAGVVTDESGAPIPGVTVTASRSGAEAEMGVTELDGAFRVADLAPGAYTVEALLDGFQPISHALTLVSGQSVQLAFRLVRAFSQMVEVTAAAVRTGEVAVLENLRRGDAQDA